MSEKDLATRIRPFSNGSEYAEYRDDNCDLCKLGFDESKGHGECKYERALDRGYIGDGLVKAVYSAVLGLGEGGSRKCSLFKSFDGVLREGTIEYERQRERDMKALEKWSGKEVEKC